MRKSLFLRCNRNGECVLYLERYQEIATKTVLTKWKRKFDSYDEIILELVKFFSQVRDEKGMVYFIGNGGSAGIAVHMTVDFLKNGKMRTHSMFDPATLTCFGNDFGYEYVFSKHLEIISNANDLLVAISSSGESKNILNAVNVAREKKCKIVTLSGFKANNSLSGLGDCNVYVSSMVYGIVESIHNMILQDVVDSLHGCFTNL